MSAAMIGDGERLRRFRVRSFGDLCTRPRPKWLVEKVLRERTRGLVYGPTGSYKSFVMLGMGLSIALGIAWEGRATKQGRVLYVTGEGEDGLRARLEAWSRASGLPIPDDFGAVTDSPNFTCDEQINELLGEILDYFPDVESKPIALVIVDTLHTAMEGADENSSTNVGLVYRAAKRISRATGAAVVFIHHTGKAGDDPRGSSALLADVDVAIQVVGEGRSKGLVSKLSNTKQKDYEKFEEITVRGHWVALDDTGEESSLAFGVTADEQCSGKACDTLAALVEHHGEHGLKSGEWEQRAVARHVSESQFKRDKKTALANGWAEEVKDGTVTRYVPTAKGRAALSGLRVVA